MPRPRFLSSQLDQNPGNPLEVLQDMRLRLEALERLIISPVAADARYAQLGTTTFHVHKGGSDQTIETATWTKVTWATEVLDRGGDFDLANSRFVAAAAGEYLLAATIYWTAFGDAVRTRLAFYRNGTVAWYGPQIHSGAVQPIGAHISVLMSLNEGDTVELYARHDTPLDVSRSIEGDATDTYWWGMKVQ